MREREDRLDFKDVKTEDGWNAEGRSGYDSVVAWNVGTGSSDENVPAERASAVCLSDCLYTQ